MKNRSLIYPLITIGLLLIFINSCKKSENSSPGNPTNGKTTAIFNTSKTYGSMTDQDGNVYKTIKIGTQTWMAENLRTTKYRNSEVIPKVTDNTAWSVLSTGAYCNYKNSSNNDTIATYGRLYNWYSVVDTRNIAPTGWHVPTDADWTTLITYLGGEGIAGGTLKELGLTHWISPNALADNTSGFTALPGGCRNNDGTFSYIGQDGDWWSSTEYGTSSAWGWNVPFNNSNSSALPKVDKVFGFSVRCLQDN